MGRVVENCAEYLKAGTYGHPPYSYRWIFSEIWDHLWPQLSKAQNEEDVKKAFEKGASPYDKEFMPYMASLVLRVLREPKCPKRRKPQINFLADSLAGVDWVSARRARDICDQERKKKVNYIFRQDYYIECTCRYKGPALHRKCPKCSTDKLDLPYSKFQM